MWIAYTLFKAYWRLCQRKDARRAASYLDQHVFSWDSKNALTVRQLVAGGIHVFGGTGVGKTSSMKQVAKSTMQIKNSSLLVLCSKRGEYREWMDMAKAMGREKDVVLVDETQNARINMVGIWQATSWRVRRWCDSSWRFAVSSCASRMEGGRKRPSGASTMKRPSGIVRLRLMCAGSQSLP